ncbi:peptidase family C78-domain-containing protein, partial [Lentinula aciculospora]
LQCQFCWTHIENLSVPERQRHYEAHLENTEGNPVPQASTSNSTSSRTFTSWITKGKLKTMSAVTEKNQDAFWYPAMQTSPPTNFTPGLIPILRKALLKSHAKGTTMRAVLCYERAVYISRQTWDASWGCGYRNFLMSCAALMDQPYQPMYFSLLDKPVSPGIRNLQTWIEQAWNNGMSFRFDVEGRRQLKRLVDTNKWIGTSDICTAFLSRGIPSVFYPYAKLACILTLCTRAELVDFEVKDFNKGLAPLTNWIVQYFDNYSKHNPGSTINTVLLGASPIQSAPCMPLIVQDNRHSRMVIGYEITKNGSVSLLVFDPSKLPSKRLRSLALSGLISSKTLSALCQGNGDGDEHHESENTSCSASQTDATNKRTIHANNDDNGSDAAWTDGDDVEIQFIGERKQDDKLIGEVRKEKDNTIKADKNVSVDEPSYSDVLKHFRWENRLLQKKQKYQILYFPLEDPLTRSEMKRRKILTSEQIS